MAGADRPDRSAAGIILARRRHCRRAQHLGLSASARGPPRLTQVIRFGYPRAMTDTTPLPLSADPRACIAAAHALGIPRDYGRTRGLRRMREPERLVRVGRDTQGRDQYLAALAARAWARMRVAAAQDGVELEIGSALR